MNGSHATLFVKVEFFVEFFAGTQAGKHNFNILFGEAGQGDEIVG